uniref:ABC transporter domain-containing protein n=1 Tax=Timema bartmani TaxID=61472 RepID=A0A7R9F3F0_9NEOP|nr:unnamed protein product [Timema bartmani]
MRKPSLSSHWEWFFRQQGDVSSTGQVLCTVTSTIFTTVMSGEHPPSSYVKEPALTFSLRYYNISTVPYSVMTGVPGLLVSTYRHLVGFEPIPSGESVSSLVLDIGKENIKEYMNNIVVGAEFNTSKTRDIVVVNAMYGSTVHHAAPLSLNLINNALVKYLMASDEYSITTTNHPLPDLQLPDLSSTTDIRTTIYWSLLVPLGLFFFLGFVIAFPLEEKVNKMKQLQIMAGVSPFYYWLICFLVDYFIYLLASVLMVVSIYVCDTLNIYKQSVELGVFFLMIVLYGLSGIPYAYIFTYFKKSATDGFCHYIFSSVLIGVTILYCSFVYKLLGWMKYLLWFLPHICLSRGLNMFSAQVVKNIRCRQLKDDKTFVCTLDPSHLCCKSNFDDSSSKRHFAYLDFPHENNENGIGLEVLFLALNSVLYVVIIMLAEYGVIHKIRKFFRKSQLSNIKCDREMDEDVVKEQIRVKKHIHGDHAACHGVTRANSSGPSSTSGGYCSSQETQKQGTNHDIFLVDKLVKMYQSFVAVNGISFGVKPGECFGLLGVNGAGKTTTFRMLTGDEVPSDGDAVVQRYGLRKHTRKYLSHLGYCPQSDPLNEKLTGQEMLQLVAHLRGIPRQSVQKEVTKWINLLGLSEYESSLSGTFSGGNKRKLSTAMALIGDPPIVFLDEPTSGVDPVSRRNLWEVLARIQSTGQSIVLTSHSMEECEALCNRVAIMVNGQFMCMGGNQYLKRKFGQGFTLMVKLGCIETAKELMELKDTIKMTFRPNCELKDEHKGMLHYRLLNPHIPWKVLFTSMEHLKNTTLAIEDYSISETSLEQVFLAFAKSQKD